MPRAATPVSGQDWAGYYRWTAKRPPRELLDQVLNHIEWERNACRGGRAVELGFGAGTDTLELLSRGWKVVAIDGQDAAAASLDRRVPPRLRRSLTCLVAPMEEVDLPPADLVYASYSLPFCPPERFPALWSGIRKAIQPGGHFAGQLFGKEDEWNGERAMTFHSAAQVRGMCEGFKVELLRETIEEGRSFRGPKHWHVFDLILGRPPMTAHRIR